MCWDMSFPYGILHVDPFFEGTLEMHCYAKELGKLINSSVAVSIHIASCDRDRSD